GALAAAAALGGAGPSLDSATTAFLACMSVTLRLGKVGSKERDCSATVYLPPRTASTDAFTSLALPQSVARNQPKFGSSRIAHASPQLSTSRWFGSAWPTPILAKHTRPAAGLS